MKQTFFIAVINKEYRGIDGIYTASPVCTQKETAEDFLTKEYNNLCNEFNVNDDWYKELNNGNDVINDKVSQFYLSDGLIYNLWGWVYEIEVDTEFTGQRFGYTIFSTKEVDEDDENDLQINLVFTDTQTDMEDVYKAIDNIVEKFKADYPCDDYDETDRQDLESDWVKEVSFENFQDKDIDGELKIWFEIHDII